jgi:tetratricopeptide (TPR) repeat protein
MIFDLKSGKRRRVVQIVFSALAFIFFISFVGFGIGSGSGGGLFDAIGLGGGSNSSDPQFDQQISDAQDAIDANPKDGNAYSDLITAYYQSASTGISLDQQTGQQSISDDARVDLEKAAQAWADYMKTKPAKPSAEAATRAVQVFYLLGDAENAASAQQIVADSQKTATAYYQLVLYLYAAGKIDAGDKAADLALAAASKDQVKTLTKTLASLRKRAIKYQHQVAQAAQQSGQNGTAGSELDNPFGALGSSSGSATVPVTPTP